MSEITAIAEKAAEEIYGHVNTDGFGGVDFERKEIVKIIEEASRAAIEAYEAAKRVEANAKLQAAYDEFEKAMREQIEKLDKGQAVRNANVAKLGDDFDYTSVLSARANQDEGSAYIGNMQVPQGKP